MVSEELKEKATQLAQQLNELYTKKDIKKIKEILISLEQGRAFTLTSDSTNNIEILKTKIDELKIKIENIKKEIESIKQDEIFEIIQMDDWSGYLESIKKELLNQYETLQQKLENLKNPEKLDNYWYEEF